MIHTIASAIGMALVAGLAIAAICWSARRLAS